MPPNRYRIVLLPGMGADARLFDRQREAVPSIVVPDWLPPDPEETLNEYARRFTQALALMRPFVLGGSSFGGMVACEMATFARPEAVVLIGSCADPSDIPAVRRRLARLAGAFPTALHSAMRGYVRLLGGLFGARTQAERDLFVEMAQATSAEFLRWACKAIASWQRPDLTGTRLFAIHGSQDRVLPARNSGSEVLVRGAGHLVAMTHPNEVNAFLVDVLAKLEGSKQDHLPGASGQRPS